MPRSNAWLVALIVILLGLAATAGLVIGRSTKDSAAPIKGAASEQVVAMVDGSLAALNRGDIDAFAAYFTKDAVFEDPEGVGTVTGRQAIADANEGYYNLGARYHRVSPVIQRGNLAAYAISCPPCPGAWSGIDLIEFDANYKTTHVWTGNTAGPLPAASP